MAKGKEKTIRERIIEILTRCEKRKAADQILELFSAQTQEFGRMVEEVIKHHVESSVPFNPLDVRDDLLKALEE